MTGSQLTLFAANEQHRFHRMTVVDWLLGEIHECGINGATVMDITEGVDRHGQFHSAGFFETVDRPVAVMVTAEDAQVDALLSRLAKGGAHLFYTRWPVTYGELGAP